MTADVGLCVATWNLQGSAGVKVDEVVGRLRELASPAEPDVVVLQEVQRTQARRLARALGARAHRWTFKHWPIVRAAEGLAVLSRHELVRTRTVTLQRAVPWSWRRRVALLAEVAAPGGSVVVADVHLSPHDLALLRGVEVERLVGALADFGAGRDALVVGDFNDLPSGTAPAALRASGWRDVWAEAHGAESPGATNWTAGPRAGRAPSQRLDYVMVPAGWCVEWVVVGGPSSGTWDAWAALSDHLPVVAHLRRA
jgi:endonuclease/exonuclease/phosphatase family metal-dependent hydrolase